MSEFPPFLGLPLNPNTLLSGDLTILELASGFVFINDVSLNI